MITPFDTNNS